MSEIVWTYVDHLDEHGRVQFFQRGVPWKLLSLSQILGPRRPHTWQVFKAFAATMSSWAPIDSDAEMLALQTRPQHEPASVEELYTRETVGCKTVVKRVRRPDAERKRAPLAYFTEQQERAKFDPFRDFVVTSDCAVESQPNTSFAGLTLDGCGAFVLPKQAW